MTFIVTKKTAVGDLKKQFSNEFGGTLRVYEGRSEALDASRLLDIAATIGKVEFLGTMTVGECIAQIQENLNLKVKVYTSDNKVALPDEITLAVIKEIPAGATKTDVAKFVGTAPVASAASEAEPAAEAAPVTDNYPTYEECVAKYKPEEIGTAYTLSKDKKTMTLEDDFKGVLVIPDGVTTVVGNKGEYDKYEEIPAVIMPDSVTSYTIKSDGVEFIRFSHNLTEISCDTFLNCKVKDLIIPEGVKVIAKSAFKYGDIETLSLPSTLEFIMNNAFDSFEGESLVIPANVKVIAADAFQYGSLKEVVFLNPDTVVIKDAFDCCYELDTETIYAEHQIGNRTIGADKIEYLTVDGAKTIRLPRTFFGKLVVEEGTEKLYEEEGCEGFRDYPISELYLPDSFDYDSVRLPRNASVIRLPDNAEKMDLCGVREIIWPSAVKEVRLAYCDDIKELVVPEGVESLELINMNSLTKLTVPESVDSLQLSCMKNLTTLILPSTLKELKLRELPLIEPFDFPKGLEKLNFHQMNWEKLVVPEGVKIIDGGSYNNNMTELILPSTLEEIGCMAFCDQPKLESVVIPANVKRIQEYAFSGCKSLKNIVFEGSPEIEDGAFEDCYKIPDPLDDDSAIYFVINSESRAIKKGDADMVNDDPYNFFAYRVAADFDYYYGVCRGNFYDLKEKFDVSDEDIEIFDMYAGEYDKCTNYPNEHENKNVFLPEWLYELCNEGFEYGYENPIIQAIECCLGEYSKNWSGDRVRCILLDEDRCEVANWLLRKKHPLDD